MLPNTFWRSQRDPPQLAAGRVHFDTIDLRPRLKTGCATVGYAAFHGLLETDEARRFLRACLPDEYHFPFAKRTMPFFAKINDTPNPRRILPCNVPASMFHFCHALKRHGMALEARALLLPIYAGMLDRGATTWWEEWNNRSSLCHAWASFVVLFLEAPEALNAP